MFVKVVGSIDQMEVDDPANTENSGSGNDSKNTGRPFDSEKTKGKRKLYVGSQALGHRRDHMEVSCVILICYYWKIHERHFHGC